MAIVESTIWLAQDRLLAALQARKATPGSALADVPVDLGYPGTVRPLHVFIPGRVEPWASVYAVSGLQVKDEEFELPVICRATRTTGDYLVARDSCRALVAEVEAAVGVDPFLGGCPITLAQVARMELAEAIPQETQRVVEATLWVSVRAQAGDTPAG